MKRSALLAVAALVLAAGTAWQLTRDDASSDLPVYWSAPDFSLVDQNGEPFERSDLRGQVWVGSFIFTHCASVCPVISARMAELRDELRAEGLLGASVRLVSITVDPARDTPDVLRRYADRFGGSPPEAWAFLTGEPPSAVRRLVQEGFRVTAMLPRNARAESGGAADATEVGEATDATGYQVSHSPRVVLVDRDGRVRGTYVATEPDAFDRLLVDVRALVQ